MTTDTRTEAETKAYNLHEALRLLLDAYIDLRKETDSEPLFESDADPDKRAQRALYDNRPLADWEPDRYEEVLAACNDAIEAARSPQGSAGS